MSYLGRDDAPERMSYSYYDKTSDWDRDARLRLHLTPQQRLTQDMMEATRRFQEHAARAAEQEEHKREFDAKQAERDRKYRAWRYEKDASNQDSEKK